MLEKLDNLYKKIIFENVEDVWFRKITKDNEFYAKYLAKLQNPYVIITKSRLNTFLIQGLAEEVIKALEAFKVDSDYWNPTVLRKRICSLFTIIYIW